MHALRRFIQEQMDARGWTADDLVKASGISKQTLSVRLNDDRERLAAPLGDETVAGLARAFGVDRLVVLSKVTEALGLPVGETVIVRTADGVSDQELVREVEKRLAVKRGSHGHQPAATTHARESLAPESVIAVVTEALETYFRRADKILDTQHGRGRDALLDELRTELKRHVATRLAEDRPSSAIDVG
jgi:transcriptional regulator with XRE-family HTH domain